MAAPNQQTASPKRDAPLRAQSEEEGQGETSDGGESIEEAIAKLTPEQAEMFMRALSLTMKKRRLMLSGTLLSLSLLILGSLCAFIIFMRAEPGHFIHWVFLVPFASAAASMWIFGSLARRAGLQSQSSLAKPLPGDTTTDNPSQRSAGKDA